MHHPNTSTAKFIRLFLVQDIQDPRLSTAELGNWTGKLFLMHRNQVKDKTYLQNSELKRRGVYFLFGPTQPQPSVYIGEGEIIIKRVKEQLVQPFWQEAVIFVSKDNYLNKASIKYLEHKLYRDLKASNLYQIINTNKPAKPEISEAEQAELEESLIHIRLLTTKLTRYYF